MSTLKVNDIRNLSNSGTENIKLESNGTTNLQATSTLGLTVVGTLNVSGLSTFTGNVVVGNATTDTVDLKSKVTGFNNFSGFTGEIRMYAGNAAGDAPPTGWLYCNGDTISSTINDGGTNAGGTHYNADGKGNDYRPLFDLLSNTAIWNNSATATWGSDKVKLPDFRSRSPVGIATGAANAADARSTGTALAAGLTSRALSIAAGTETHALTTAQLAAHTHASTIVANSTGVTAEQSGHTHTLSAHTHTSAGHLHSSAGHLHTIGSHQHMGPLHRHGSAVHNHTFSGSPMGTHYHGTGLDPSLYTTYDGGSASQSGAGGYVNKRTSADSAGTPAGSISSVTPSDVDAGGEILTGGVTNGTNTGSTTPGNTGSTTPGVTGGPSTANTSSTDPTITMTDPTHTHTLTAVSTGSGTAHTILSPIIAVNYLIKV